MVAEVGGAGGAGAGDSEEVGGGGVEDAAEGAEALEEGVGEGFGVAGADGEAEDELEDLVVVEGVEAGAVEAVPQALAVTFCLMPRSIPPFQGSGRFGQAPRCDPLHGLMLLI